MRITEREPRHLTGTSISGAPSVAAVVTSIDREFAQYPVNFRVQNPCVEIVQEIKPMIRERLEMCKAEDGKVYPSRYDHETFFPLPLLALKVSSGCFKVSRGERPSAVPEP